jgi:hypothetical protein
MVVRILHWEGETRMFCSKCGAQIGPDARVCPQCGNVQGALPVTPAVVWNGSGGRQGADRTLDFSGMGDGDRGYGQLRADFSDFRGW